MRSVDFIYWFKGFLELSGAKSLNETQTELVKRHLNLVFVHEIDPSAGPPEHQEKLNEIHNNTPKPPGPPQNKPHNPNKPTLYRC